MYNLAFKFDDLEGLKHRSKKLSRNCDEFS